MWCQRNYGVYEGRLVNDPVYFATAGGSEVALLKIGCRRNYKPKGAESAESDFAEFRAFVPKSTAGHGIYAYLHKGDLVSVQYTLRTGSSEQADGSRSYFQSCMIENLEIKEGRQIREERLAARNGSSRRKK